MEFMCVSFVELLHQAAREQIIVLEYMLSGARGLPQPHSVVRGAKCGRFTRPWCW
jgi:hypothetical protein